MAGFFDRFMTGLAGGTGPLSSFAKSYNTTLDNDAYKRGVQQINSGDWQGGVDIIASRNPEVALGLAQYKQKSDDDIALQQMKNEQANQITPYQERYLNYLENKDKQEDNNPFSSKNEFINLLGIRNNAEVWDNLPDDQKSLINSRLNYMSNNPEVIYETGYQKKSGTLQAERESKDIENKQINQQQQQTLSNAIGLVESLPDSLFMPYSEYTSKAGTLTEGYLGMSPEENEQYGYLERTIGQIENDLIQKARSKGQVGINTIAEIKQAAKGLQLGQGKARLKGALQAMLEIEKKLDAMPTIMTMMPQNTQLTDYKSKYGLE